MGVVMGVAIGIWLEIQLQYYEMATAELWASSNFTLKL